MSERAERQAFQVTEVLPLPPLFLFTFDQFQEYRNILRVVLKPIYNFVQVFITDFEELQRFDVLTHQRPSGMVAIQTYINLLSHTE